MLILCFKFNGTTQNISVINNGCNIYVAGNGSILGTPTISIHGSYLNLNDGISDGRIEENFGNIWLDENWTNNANNNVFTNLSSSNSDGIVTFHNTTNIQYIDGINPTNFENIYLNDYRKKLLNDNNLVNGILHLDAALDLNSHNFIINNANPTAINYISGFIKSETFPGNYSLLQWNIGAGLGVYSVPFGSDYQTFNDLNYSIDIQTPMADGDNIKFATYPTDIYNNPLPTGASNLELEVLKVVDRYWIISPSNPLNKPKVNMTFSFSSNDINSGYNSINIKNLKASRNNSTLGKWMDMTPRGYNAANTVTIENVMPADFFDAWTLVNIPGPLANVFVPDAFTPNGDGLNDEFLPVFQVDYQIISYDFYIFDRWGNIQLHTSDETKGWNGKKDNVNGVPNIGVYSWLIIVKGKNSENLDGDGVKEKFIGKVTLLK
ncbi:MAG: hypothetical protein AUJ98_03125 [Bacteroidetes bacterium CG2_30_33_31]|nr:MAG: hypothetical protein AUJ98_03125 [Bacteroidetes bacterium CG2_30_33_31]